MPALPSKKAVALDLLERTSVFVHLDPRRPGVEVPPQFASQPQLVLQVGLNMQVAIPDLDVDDDGITCTLSFNRRPHFCCLPWAAIYALIGEPGSGGMVWPDDVPPEVVAQQQSRAARARAPRRRHLRAVPGRGEDAAAPQSSPAAAVGPPEAGRSEPAAAQASSDASSPATSGDSDSAGAASAPRRAKRQRPPYLRLVE
jgi:stringent starvation protein B